MHQFPNLFTPLLHRSKPQNDIPKGKLLGQSPVNSLELIGGSIEQQLRVQTLLPDCLDLKSQFLFLLALAPCTSLLHP